MNRHAKISQFPIRHPYWFVFFIVLLILLLQEVVSFATFNRISYGEHALLFNFLLLVILSLLVSYFGWWTVIGFQPLAKATSLVFYLVPTLVIVINGFLGLEISNFENLYWWTITAFLVGFSEEMAIRGIVLQTLLPKGKWKAILISSLIFSAFHFSLPSDWWGVVSVALVLLYQTVGAITFAILRIQFHSIVPLIVVHSLIDLSFFLLKPGSPFTSIPGWAVFLPLLAVDIGYLIFLFIKFGLLKKPNHIVDQ